MQENEIIVEEEQIFDIHNPDQLYHIDEDFMVDCNKSNFQSEKCIGLIDGPNVESLSDDSAQIDDANLDNDGLKSKESLNPDCFSIELSDINSSQISMSNSDVIAKSEKNMDEFRSKPENYMDEFRSSPEKKIDEFKSKPGKKIDEIIFKSEKGIGNIPEKS